MSVIGSNILAGASGQGGGYNLTKSLRFRSSASAYLNRTPASSSNLNTWTISWWTKRGQLSTPAQTTMFGTDYAASQEFMLQFTANNRFVFEQYAAGGVVVLGSLITTQVFRDPSAWYHFVVTWDSTQATAANRIKIYVNGVQITAFDTAVYPSQNASSVWNQATNQHRIGQYSTAKYYDGYMTEINAIDGQALTPTSFGSFNALTGVWQPARYTGTYGTNGFYLPFTDTTSTSTLGTDFSGNSNTWTVNNISLTAGSTYDSMTDVPTLTDATTANYAVINPLQNGGLTITNGNLTWAGAGSSAKCATGSIAMPSGKWYFEALITGSSGGNWYAGVCNLSPTLTSAPVITSTGWGLMTGGGGTVLYKVNNNTFTSLSSSSVTGSVVSFAIDVDAGKIWFAQNGTWLEGSPSAGTGASYTNLTGTQIPFVAGYDSNDQGSINFGQRPFAYTPPTGFVALNTFNLPTPTIGATASSQANKYFDATLYTGTGASTQTVTNSNSMQPDFVWVKDRSQSTRHVLTDSVRGAGLSLYSNTTDSEGTNDSTGYMSAFNSNGFTLNRGSGGLGERVNYSGDAYVGWQWRASNATAVTNTAGSITSTVSANTTAGFSIVTWSQGASSGTVGHGLGVAPSMIIGKTSGNSGFGWHVYHSSLGVNKYLFLNLPNGESTSSGIWSTLSDTVFGASTGLFEANQTQVAYCFAQVAGYSAFGSYTGNNASDGTFVYLGFRPKFIMIKSTSAGTEWVMVDSTRNTYNLVDTSLYANRAYSESTIGTVDDIDFLSNGFKLRNNTGYVNASQTYIYMAFAEFPFRYSLAR